jgi:hypothetical protein
MATPVEAALRRAVADLNALNTRWALVGGLVILVRSVPRFTKDLDFQVRQPPTLTSPAAR